MADEAKKSKEEKPEKSPEPAEEAKPAEPEGPVRRTFTDLSQWTTAERTYAPMFTIERLVAATNADGSEKLDAEGNPVAEIHELRLRLRMISSKRRKELIEQSRKLYPMPGVKRTINGEEVKAEAVEGEPGYAECVENRSNWLDIAWVEEATGQKVPGANTEEKNRWFDQMVAGERERLMDAIFQQCMGWGGAAAFLSLAGRQIA